MELSRGEKGMSIFAGMFGKKTEQKKPKSKQIRVLLINRSKFVDALLKSLPKKNAWTVYYQDELDWEALEKEVFDLVVYSFSETKTEWTMETAASYVKENLLALLDWLEFFQAHPPAQFVFVSSWKAEDSESVIGAVYQNGEILVEGYARAGGCVAKCLRRLHATEEAKRLLELSGRNMEQQILNWLAEETSSGTYNMILSEKDGTLTLERLERSNTDFLVSKKILTNMKDYFASDQIMEGLLYLKQLRRNGKESTFLRTNID